MDSVWTALPRSGRSLSLPPSPFLPPSLPPYLSLSHTHTKYIMYTHIYTHTCIECVMKQCQVWISSVSSCPQLLYDYITAIITSNMSWCVLFVLLYFPLVSGCTHHEVQIPCTAWAAEGICVTVSRYILVRAHSLNSQFCGVELIGENFGTSPLIRGAPSALNTVVLCTLNFGHKTNQDSFSWSE